MVGTTRGIGVLAVAAFVGVTTPATDARACGGCFVPPDANTQVTGHRMLLSLSQQQSTLYDQIEYAGSPDSFAWVLPIVGTAEVGLSSDLVFNQLALDTDVLVLPPPFSCPTYPPCPGTTTSWTTSTTTSTTGGVQVIASEVVGPYETVQLAANDPTALTAWLLANGYDIPADIAPVLASYVADQFNFLAMKLVPGAGIDAMQPVRVTTAGASPTLPLRMVAAGTGVTTTVTLWVIGEGRYEPQNFPSFDIPADSVVWNWTTQDSNYDVLRQLGYDASGGLAWLTESAAHYDIARFTNAIDSIVYTLPGQSGYGGGDPDLAIQEAEADLAVLFAGLAPADVWVTRLRAELSRDAFATDLLLQASLPQDPVNRIIQTQASIGSPPVCPAAPVCGGSAGSDGGVVEGGGCTTQGLDATPGLGLGLGWLAGLGLLLAARRRR